MDIASACLFLSCLYSIAFSRVLQLCITYLEFRVLIVNKDPIVQGTIQNQEKISCCGFTNHLSACQCRKFQSSTELGQVALKRWPESAIATQIRELVASMLLWLHLLWHVSRAVHGCLGYNYVWSSLICRQVQSWWVEVIGVGAECSTFSDTQGNGKVQTSDGFEQWNRPLLDYVFFCCAIISPGITGCSQENRVRNVLSSLHFRFVDLCQWRTGRSVVNENTHLHYKNLALCKISETGERLHMRTSIGHSMSKLIETYDIIVKTLFTG